MLQRMKASSFWQSLVTVKPHQAGEAYLNLIQSVEHLRTQHVHAKLSKCIGLPLYAHDIIISLILTFVTNIPYPLNYNFSLFQLTAYYVIFYSSPWLTAVILLTSFCLQ